MVPAAKHAFHTREKHPYLYAYIQTDTNTHTPTTSVLCHESRGLTKATKEKKETNSQLKKPHLFVILDLHTMSMFVDIGV